MSPCSREQSPRGHSDNLMSEVYYLGFRLVKIWVNLHSRSWWAGHEPLRPRVIAARRVSPVGAHMRGLAAGAGLLPIRLEMTAPRRA